MNYISIISQYINNDFNQAANVIKFFAPVLTDREYNWLKNVWSIK